MAKPWPRCPQPHRHNRNNKPSTTRLEKSKQSVLDVSERVARFVLDVPGPYIFRGERSARSAG
jgi:hypothetical protein